jgi:hypothetical protein
MRRTRELAASCCGLARGWLRSPVPVAGRGGGTPAAGGLVVVRARWSPCERKITRCHTLSPVRVDVLGAIRAFRNGEPVDLQGRKQRQVLAALALYGGRPVSVDALIDLLWGEAPPPTAVSTLHGRGCGGRLSRTGLPVRPRRSSSRSRLGTLCGCPVRRLTRLGSTAR